jgi:hypothetical protein
VNQFSTPEGSLLSISRAQWRGEEKNSFPQEARTFRIPQEVCGAFLQFKFHKKELLELGGGVFQCIGQRYHGAGIIYLISI